MMTKLTPIEIAHLEEHRQAKGTAEVSLEAEPVAGGIMCFSGPGSWSNQAVALGLDGPVTDDELDRLVAFYVERGVEPRIEVSPFVDASLFAGLARRGFQLREMENVLACDLGGDEARPLRERHPLGWPDELEVVRVDPTDEAAVRTHVEIATSGFRPLDRPIDESMFEIGRRVVRHPRTRAFTATLEGVAVGAGAMEVGEAGEAGGASALFGTSVLEQARRRGVQLALILTRLDEARRAGARVATIGSRPGISTERNAARVGFGMAYSKAILAMQGEGLVPSP